MRSVFLSQHVTTSICTKQNKTTKYNIAVKWKENSWFLLSQRKGRTMT